MKARCAKPALPWNEPLRLLRNAHLGSKEQLLAIRFGRRLSFRWRFFFDSGFFYVLFAGLAVGTPESLRGERAEVGHVGWVLLVKDVRIEHGAEEQSHRGFEVEILGQNTARDDAPPHRL